MDFLSESFGFLFQYPLWAVIVSMVLVAVLFAFWGLPLWAWSIGCGPSRVLLHSGGFRRQHGHSGYSEDWLFFLM